MLFQGSVKLNIKSIKTITMENLNEIGLTELSEQNLQEINGGIVDGLLDGLLGGLVDTITGLLDGLLGGLLGDLLG